MNHARIDELNRITSGRVRAYRGPLNVSWITSVAHLMANVAKTGAVRYSDAERLLLYLHGWIDTAPRTGMPALLHATLQECSQALFGDCPSYLLLEGSYDVEDFRSFLNYPQLFEESPSGTPFAWNANEPRLERAQAADEQSAQVPAICNLRYPAHQASTAVLWPAAYHELGHHLFVALSRLTTETKLPQWLADFEQCQEYSGLGKLLSPDTDTEELLSEAQRALVVKAVSTVTSWFEEMFADIVATHLIGPSYCVALRYFSRQRTGTRIESSHPPLSLRLRNIGPLVENQANSCPDVIALLITQAVNPDSKLWFEENSPEYHTPNEHPIFQYALQNYSEWSCVNSKMVKQILQSAALGPWPLNGSKQNLRSEIDYLLNSVLAYVPPAGRLVIDGDQEQSDDRYIKLVPSAASLMFLVGIALRVDETLWNQFRKPWVRETSSEEDANYAAEAALSKLIVKAISDSWIERRLAGGIDRTEHH